MDSPMITVSVFVFDPPVCSDNDFWKSLKKPFMLSAYLGLPYFV